MLRDFFAEPAGQAAVAIFVVGLLQFVLDQAAAIRDQTFTLVGIADWLRKPFMDRIFPVWLLLFVGWAAHDVQLIGDVLLIAALAWSGIYVAEAIKHILDEWAPKAEVPT